MLNISTQGEKLVLDRGYYFVIDALYLNDVRDYIQSMNQKKILNFDKLKIDVFPYTDISFAIIEIKRKINFDINHLQKVEYYNISNPTNKYVASDTGVLIFIKRELVVKFVEQYDFEKLIDIEPINIDYWYSIIKNFNGIDIGLLISPGLNSGYQFDGDGIYQVISTNIDIKNY